MKKIFITATNTDIGKTYTTIELTKSFAKLGYKVACFKPIETGVTDKAPDGEKLFSISKRFNPKIATLSIDDIVAITLQKPAAPFIAAEGEEIALEAVFEALKRFENRCDILLIEGAGGLFVPIEKEYFVIDLIEDLQVDATLLVTHCSLGCINDTLLSQNALKERNLPFVTAFNCKGEEAAFATTSKPYFDAVGEKIYIVDKNGEELAKALLDLSI